MLTVGVSIFFFSSRRRHTRFDCDWSSDVCSSDLQLPAGTEIVAHTTNAISSGLESPVVAVVDRSVKVGDTVVIPEGAHVIGHTAGAAKDRVNVRFTSVVLPKDREIPISGLGLMKDGTAGAGGRGQGK